MDGPLFASAPSCVFLDLRGDALSDQCDRPFVRIAAELEQRELLQLSVRQDRNGVGNEAEDGFQPFARELLDAFRVGHPRRTGLVCCLEQVGGRFDRRLVEALLPVVGAEDLAQLSSLAGIKGGVVVTQLPERGM